jgi:hypothetical protein
MISNTFFKKGNLKVLDVIDDSFIDTLGYITDNPLGYELAEGFYGIRVGNAEPAVGQLYPDFRIWKNDEEYVIKEEFEYLMTKNDTFAHFFNLIIGMKIFTIDGRNVGFGIPELVDKGFSHFTGKAITIAYSDLALQGFDAGSRFKSYEEVKQADYDELEDWAMISPVCIAKFDFKSLKWRFATQEQFFHPKPAIDKILTTEKDLDLQSLKGKNLNERRNRKQGLLTFTYESSGRFYNYLIIENTNYLLRMLKNRFPEFKYFGYRLGEKLREELGAKASPSIGEEFLNEENPVIGNEGMTSQHILDGTSTFPLLRMYKIDEITFDYPDNVFLIGGTSWRDGHDENWNYENLETGEEDIPVREKVIRNAYILGKLDFNANEFVFAEQLDRSNRTREYELVMRTPHMKRISIQKVSKMYGRRYG